MSATAGGASFDGGSVDANQPSEARSGASRATPPSSGLVSHWKLDEGSGTVVGDFSGQGNTCVIAEGAQWSQEGAPLPEGPSPFSMRFHGGANERLDCAASPLLRFNAPLTIATWFNWPTVSSMPAMLVLLVSEEKRLALALGIRAGQIGIWKWGGTSPVGTRAPDRGWHHVASTYDGRQYRLYLDGVLWGLSSMPMAEAPVAEVIVGGQRVRAEPFRGLLDDVRLYNRALSAEEIRDLYAGRSQRALYVLGAAAAILFALLVGQRIRLYHVRGRFNAILNERNRIARDLHDTLAQGFTGVSYQLGLLAQQLEEVPGPSRATLAQVRQTVGHVRLEARQLIGNLRSQSSHSPSLRAALEEMGRLTRVLGNASTQVVIQGNERPLSDNIVTDLLRIAQEATANSLEHGKAGNVSVLVSFTTDEVHLRVEDDGIGFDVTNVTPNLAHFGIRGMRERVDRLRGRFTLQAAPGKGAVIEVSIPTPTRP